MVNRIVSLIAMMLIFFSYQSEVIAQNQSAAFNSSNISDQLGKNMNAPSNKELTATLDSLVGDNFPICEERGDQRLPAIAFNSIDSEYLIIWQDNRNNPNSADIYGRRAAINGNPLGNDFPICIASSHQLYPALAYNSKDNEYLAIWVDHRNRVQGHPHDIHLYGQRIASNGTLINTDFPISTMLTDIIRNPEIAYCDSLNEYLAVWETDIDTTGPPYGWVIKIRGKHVSNTGELIDNPWTLPDESDPRNSFPVSVEEDSEHQGIVPDIAYNSRDAQYLVVWRDGRYVPGSGNDDIFGQIISCTGKHLLNHDIPICLQHDRNGIRGQNQDGASVSYNEKDNEYLVAWFDARNDSNRTDNIFITDIYGQRVSHEGLLLDNPHSPENEADPMVNFPICSADGIQYCPYIAFDKKEGIFVVVWSDGRNDPGNLSNFDIYGQCLSSKGELLDDLSTPQDESDPKINFIISNAPKNQGTWSVPWAAEENWGISMPDYTNNSEYLVVWADQRNKDVSGDDIYGQQIKYIRGLISGYINYYSDEMRMVNNAVVSLSGFLIKQDTTNVNGYYNFSNLHRGNYSTKPGKEYDLDNAITAYDASLILQYAVGSKRLSPYQKIASDVSGNGAVTAYDASFILRYVVGLIDSFQVMPDTSHFWTFVPTNFPIDSTNWSTAPDSLCYEPLMSDTLNQNFVGIIYGDVSGNWNPIIQQISATKATSKDVFISLGEVTYFKDNIYSIALELAKESDLISGSFTIKHDPAMLKILDVNLSELTSSFSLAYKVDEGQVKIALAGIKPLTEGGDIVNLRYVMLQDFAESSCPFLITEAMLNEGNMITNIWQDEIGSLTLIPSEFGLSQNYPNPFNPETGISYQVPKASRITIKIFNLLGQHIKTLVDEQKTPGNYQIIWNGMDDQDQAVGSGVYLYKMQAGDFKAMKKMVLVR